MKKKIILSLTLLFLCGAFPLGNTFADQNDPTPPDQGGITDDPQSQDSDEPETSEPGISYVIGGRDLQIRKAKTPDQPYIKITEEGGGWNCGDECAKTGEGYSYDAGVLTLNNFGLEEELIINYVGEHPLEIKLIGTNNFDFDASSSDCVVVPTSPSPTLSCGTVTFSGGGIMNGDIRMSSDNSREELIDSGYSPNIENNGATINANKIANKYGSIILNGGETNVSGAISAQKVKINDGQLNIDSETAGIEISNSFDKSGDPSLTINGGSVSIVAKENAIREVYGSAIYGGTSLTKEDFNKHWDNLISLGTGVGVKETDITIQGYKMLNSRIAFAEGFGGETQAEPYTYYSSLSYGNFKNTKGGSSIRDAVKVLHIGKEFKNQISKNSKIGVMDTLKNVNNSGRYIFDSCDKELEIKEIKIDGKTLDPTKYQTEGGYEYVDFTIPAKTLFEIGVGKHQIAFKFNEESLNTNYEFEILETLKDYEYLLTYVDNPILKGEDETLILGDSASYRASFDRNIQLFDGFTIDGKEVPEKFYEIKSGSTVIEISPEFLNTLAIGKHEISAKFLAEDEPLSTNFTMTEAKKESKPEDKDKKTTEDKTVNNPGTGLYSKDNSFAGSSTLITVTIVVAVSTIALAIWSIKTKRFKH